MKFHQSLLPSSHVKCVFDFTLRTLPATQLSSEQLTQVFYLALDTMNPVNQLVHLKILNITRLTPDLTCKHTDGTWCPNRTRCVEVGHGIMCICNSPLSFNGETCAQGQATVRQFKFNQAPANNDFELRYSQLAEQKYKRLLRGI
ncbi:hypothetical protein P879_07828 [Paragonimus westermani]|uniref:EGF-like domain-containing protein n=1 Tax=Paragonimus westermani TaxID=34504 RepID=A0A8T0D0F7_9TREM|nr:hypothetical protein P879_07828 [Paragonimus westermani]